MTVATQRQGGGGYVERGGGSSSLADVVELILDRGLVIDMFVRVSLVGIEILTVDARIVVASVEPTCASPRPRTDWTCTPRAARACRS
jgi:hypothetical protein